MEERKVHVIQMLGSVSGSTAVNFSSLQVPLGQDIEVLAENSKCTRNNYEYAEKEFIL